MKVVIDASTFISLAKINNLHILLNLKSTLLMPDEIYEEAVIAGERKKIPDATAIKQFVGSNNIKTMKARDKSSRDLFSVLRRRLSKGDCAVIALSVQEGAEAVITDDEGLGKIAFTLGFKVIASPDLLLQSFKEGFIGFNEF